MIIGIPVKGDIESFNAMLMSLINSTNAYDKIVIATPDKDVAALDIPKVEIIYKPFKTSLEAYNTLFDLAKKEKSDLFLTQTDVLFPKLYKRDWLEIMKDIAQNEAVGAVTCINGGGVSGPDYIDGFYWLGGWCTYFPYRTIEKIGGYDKNFPRGWGVDIDHTYRITREGLTLIKVNYWVDHHMTNTRQHDSDEQGKQAASKYFKKKWKL